MAGGGDDGDGAVFEFVVGEEIGYVAAVDAGGELDEGRWFFLGHEGYSNVN